ncbi:PaaI family thioesterase [Polymorphobacter sp.]|uniref:PaaI family thioesterase n=1 Tax=Polymorphobacter sp. TaxID=1909290 RepID=UPI003F6F45B3
MAIDPIETGPLAGWQYWARDTDGRFGTVLGDLHMRERPDSTVQIRIETERRHTNVLGYLHGGFIMSFIDVAMFGIIHRQLETSSAVTLSCATDFLGAGIVGPPLEVTGEVLKETGKMVFVRGLVRQNDANIASFTGTLRKIPKQPRLADNVDTQ